MIPISRQTKKLKDEEGETWETGRSSIFLFHLKPFQFEWNQLPTKLRLLPMGMGIQQADHHESDELD